MVTGSYTLKNLLKPIGQETFMIDNGSVACEMSSKHVKYGDLALLITGDEGDNEKYGVSTTKYPLDPTHIYYACVEVYSETGQGSIDFFFPNASPSFFGGKKVYANKWTKWAIVAGRSSFTAGNYPYRLDYNNGGVAGEAWFDGSMLIDLTDAFGSGNEPDLTWCNEHISFFEGSLTLNLGTALGNTFLDNFALGDTFLDAIYLGEDLIWQKAINYNYGDGSLNTVSLGYEGVLLLNGTPVDHSNGSYYSGNFRAYGADTQGNSNTLRPLLEALRTSSVSRTYITSGTVTYTLSVDASEQDMTLWLCVFGSGMTTSAYIGSLKFNVDGAFYTLSEMVSNGFIKPLVIMASSASNGKYYWNNLFNLYTGGKTASGNYAALDLVFMLNKGHKITQFQLYANKKFNTTYDGWQASMAPTRDCRLTIE